jgi:hypothetical protein
MTGNSYSIIPFNAPIAVYASTGFTELAWMRTSTSASPTSGTGRSSRRPGVASKLSRVKARIGLSWSLNDFAVDREDA